MGRIGTVEDIAHIATMLVSERGRYTTGTAHSGRRRPVPGSPLTLLELRPVLLLDTVGQLKSLQLSCGREG